MILLLDIGNTNTHLGIGDSRRVVRNTNIPTSAWANHNAKSLLKQFARKESFEGAVLSSVVPRATNPAIQIIKQLWNLDCLELSVGTLKGIGIDYPRPRTIGSDRLANAVAVHHHFGAPSLAIDFGTAVTFDVINKSGNYVGGIIAPGLAAMTEYLREKTALLPKIKIQEIKSVIGKSTREAINVGAVHGYRGLVRALLQEVKRELGTRRLPVVAAGGYAKLIAANLPEITAVEPVLTLEGIRLIWHAHHSS